MSVISDIETLLTSYSNIFLGFKPDSPNNCIVLFDSGGLDPVMSFNKTEIINPNFQILVRNETYETGYGYAESIGSLLNGKSNFTVGSKKYLSIYQRGHIFSLGKDDLNRYQFTINFTANINQ